MSGPEFSTFADGGECGECREWEQEHVKIKQQLEAHVARIATLEAVLTKISKMDTGEWSREDMAAVARDALLPLS